jgi:glycine cleavage system H protein
LKYTQEHEYIRVEENVAYIGISFFAQRELGDIVFVDIEKHLDSKIDKDSTFGFVEAVKTVSDLFAPITGKLLEINQNVIDNPSLLNEDCYENWIIKVEIEDASELENLLSSEDYSKLIGV